MWIFSCKTYVANTSWTWSTSWHLQSCSFVRNLHGSSERTTSQLFRVSNIFQCGAQIHNWSRLTRIERLPRTVCKPSAQANTVANTSTALDRTQPTWSNTALQSPHQSCKDCVVRVTANMYANRMNMLVTIARPTTFVRCPRLEWSTSNHALAITPDNAETQQAQKTARHGIYTTEQKERSVVIKRIVVTTLDQSGAKYVAHILAVEKSPDIFHKC